MARSMSALLVALVLCLAVGIHADDANGIQVARQVPQQKSIVKTPPVKLVTDPGRPSYDRFCASCHGVDGMGDSQKAFELGVTQLRLYLGRPELAGYTHETMEQLILDGQHHPKMPAFRKKLAITNPPTPIDPLVNYTLALAKSLREAK